MSTQNKIFKALFTAMIIIIAASLYQCSSSRKASEQENQEIIKTNIDATGSQLEISFYQGPSHNHPLMVFWIEGLNGNYIETLFISESIGTSYFGYGDNSKGVWDKGERRRPAALPYWGHKRGFVAPDGLYLPTAENPMPDAVTGATPQGDFRLETKTSQSSSPKFNLMMEINQTWDWNEYWTNNKYPNDPDYMTSCQPALVYQAKIDLSSPDKVYELKPIGHSHYSGKDGKLYTDLSTITTALKIVDMVKVEKK